MGRGKGEGGRGVIAQMVMHVDVILHGLFGKILW